MSDHDSFTLEFLKNFNPPKEQFNDGFLFMWIPATQIQMLAKAFESDISLKLEYSENVCFMMVDRQKVKPETYPSSKLRFYFEKVAEIEESEEEFLERFIEEEQQVQEKEAEPDHTGFNYLYENTTADWDNDILKRKRGHFQESRKLFFRSH